MAPADRIAAYFTRKAPAYRQGPAAAAFEPVRRAEEAAVDALMGPVRDLDVLELGCGDGHYAQRLAQQGARVLGVDVSPGLAGRARARGVEVVEADAATVQLGRTFPRILSAGLLEFVDRPDAVLHNALRHAEPHAVLVVLLPRNTPTGRLYRRWHARHGIEVTLFDDGALPAMAQRTGWRVVARRHAALFAHVARLERTG